MHVFVDTAAWIALLNNSDGLHTQAQQVMRDLQARNDGLVTTEFVLLEVADAFAAPSSRLRAAKFIDGLRSMTLLDIFPATQTLLIEGWSLFKSRPDKAWGLTDCTSFVVMTQERITQVFTSDHHFEQAGFHRLLLP